MIDAAQQATGRGHVRIYKTKAFTRFARKARLPDRDLCTAIADAAKGLVDADLGGGVIKQRIARQGGGKSGGFRTIILFRLGARAFFVHGFAKNEKDNIDAEELVAFRLLATQLQSYGEAALIKAIENGTLTEVRCDE